MTLVKESRHRPFLDRLRWVSAAVVAVGHAIAILNDKANGSALLSFIADARSEAVIIFFVISGYLIGGPLLRRRDVELRKYAIKRSVRIYIVLLPALVLTLVLDFATLWLWPGNAVVFQAWQGGALGDIAVTERMTAINFISSLFNIEPLLAKPFGSAGSLWSLGYEWLFYFFLPLLLLASNAIGLGRRGSDIVILGSIGAIGVLSPIGAAFWLVWLMGAYSGALNISGIERWSRNASLIKLAAFVSATGLLFFGHMMPHQISILGLGISVAVFLNIRRGWEQAESTRIDTGLAEFSYSLYVTHLQIQTFLAALLYQLGYLPAQGISAPLVVLGYSAVFVLVSCLFGYLFGVVFERKTDKVSAALIKMTEPDGVRSTR